MNEVIGIALEGRPTAAGRNEGTLRHRLATRTTNLFGKDPVVLEQILTWNQDLEQRYRSYGATIIDATRPLEDVVEDVLALGV